MIKQECPTLWRMYDYVGDTERIKILNDREQLRDLDLGDGGEGYIGPDDWCYNCGGCGHLGDVSINSTKLKVMSNNYFS